MKISKLCETLIIAFSLLANTIFLFSQESGIQTEVKSDDGKCHSLIVTPSNRNVTSSSGTTKFTVVSNISWTSSSNQAWCTVTPSGKGNGTITATYQANTGAGSRVAAITVRGSGVADQVVTVTQLGSAPALIVIPLNRNVTSPAGTTTFGVASNLAWRAASNQAWCTVTSSGNGNGTITASYQSNPGAGLRVASITVSGSGVSDQVVTVTQLGTAPALLVVPLNQNVGSAAGATAFTVTSNISWTATCDQNWCTVTPSGKGNGTITASYQENTGSGIRIATITVTCSAAISQKVTVTQSGKAPSLIVTPVNQNVSSSAGTTSFDVASNIEWTSSSNQAWCTVTPSGRGNGTIIATYQAYTGTAPRVAAITVKGSGVSDQVVTVTQLGSSPVLIVTPLNRNVTSSAGTTSFGVASNLAWSAACDQAWCTVTPSGNGNGTITASYQSNPGAGSRVASITVSGSGVSDQVVTVTQLGTAPALIIVPLNQNVGSAAGATTFTVTSNISWTTSCDQTWCTVTPMGQGNGTITATFQENTGAGIRIASITVSGSGVSDQMVTVTQSGTAPSLIVTPVNQKVTYSAGTTSFNVASNIDWTATSDQPWCIVTPSGKGNGTIIAAFEANTVTSSRTATITVKGPGVNNQIVTVTQSGVPPLLIVTPLNRNVTSSSGTTSFDVTSNIAWTSSSDQSWCSVTPSGSGNGTITATYQENTTAIIRVATITIMGPGVSNQVVTVTQDELITISYSGSPWCTSGDIQEVLLSGTSGGHYSAQPAGLDIDPVTGSITPGTSGTGSYTVKYTLEKPLQNRVLEAFTDVAIRTTVAPHLAVKWEDILICPNLDSSILSYQWFSDTTPISGATKQYYVTSKIPGIYAVEVTDVNGCKVMSDSISIGGFTKSLSVYPNPAKGSFTLRFSDAPVGNTRIRIINTAGIEVMNLNAEKPDFEFIREISTGYLNKGFYSVQVIVGDVYVYNVKILVIK